jgi:uncharacterized protein YecT (DUF1311 family)
MRSFSPPNVIKAVRFLSVILTLIVSGEVHAQHMNTADAPCKSAGSGAETTTCFVTAAKSADTEMNHTYRELIDKLNQDDRNKLRTVQRLWIQFRDANCKAERDLYTGGSAYSMVYAACMESETRYRTNDLRQMYVVRMK